MRWAALQAAARRGHGTTAAAHVTSALCTPWVCPPCPASPPTLYRHLRTDSDSEVLLNILADEVHRAHQRCLQTTGCDPNRNKTEFFFEAGETAMRLLKVRRQASGRRSLSSAHRMEAARGALSAGGEGG